MSNTRFAQMKIEKVIMHEVPKAKKGDEDAAPIQFSEIESQAETASLIEIKDKIAKDLNRTGRSIIANSDNESRVPEIIRKFFSTGGDFIESSKELAKILRETQNGANSAGLLVVAQISLENKSCLAIVKLEHETAVRAEFSEHEGKKTVKVSHLKDLLFSDKTKVYKIGLFVGGGDEVVGYIADRQAGSGQVAKFFLKQYLGCQLSDDPKELTKKFYDSTLKWINQSVKDPETKSRRVIQLITDLGNNEASISVNQFARKYMNEDNGEMDEYCGFMKSEGVETRPFSKDNSLIENKINELQYVFSSGVIVTTPTAAFDSGSIKSESIENESLKMTIIDTLEEVKSRPKKKSSKEKSTEEAPGE